MKSSVPPLPPDDKETIIENHETAFDVTAPTLCEDTKSQQRTKQFNPIPEGSPRPNMVNNVEF